MDNSITALVPLAETMQLGEVLAKSGFFEDSRQAAQAVVKVLAGREIGIGPVASMTGIHIIKGKPAIGANLIAATIKRSGRYNYRIRKHDATVCDIEFFERAGDKWDSLGNSVFTLEDAKKAGTQNLERFPRNMLFARAMSNGARWYCPDIFGGAPVYTPEELGAPVNEDGEVIDGAYRPVESQPVTPVTAPGNGADKPANVNGDSLATQPQIAKIHVICGKLYTTPEQIAAYRAWLKAGWGVESSKHLTVKQASEVIEMLVAEETRAAAQTADSNQ